MIERKIMKNINQQELKLNILYKEEYPYLKKVDSLVLANGTIKFRKSL